MIQQIPKIRIGNTIKVAIAVLSGGQPRDLTGLSIFVALIDPWGTATRVNGWTIDGDEHNVVRFALQGTSLNCCGIYKIAIYENAGKEGQQVVDTRLFELVSETAMEKGANEGLAEKDVDMSVSSIMMGTGIADIRQVKSSSESLGENIWRITMTDGREYNIAVRNGAQGESGRTPEKGTDYFTDSDIDNIRQGLYEKPSSGIPAEDLSEEVRASLAKADAALHGAFVQVNQSDGCLYLVDGDSAAEA